MLANFHYAAHRYINDWLGWDKHLHAALAPQANVDVETGAKILLEFAKSYAVHRTLRVTDETPRLGAAYRALVALRDVPESEVVTIVGDYAAKLQSTHGTVYPLSAASKFLWMRFRNPVIIYDSIASEWLNKNYVDKRYKYKNQGYGAYVESWSRAYQQVEDRIREACTELRSVKKFIRYEVSDSELLDCTSSPWFMKRVFDYSMIYPPVLNQSSQELFSYATRNIRKPEIIGAAPLVVG